MSALDDTIAANTGATPGDLRFSVEQGSKQNPDQAAQARMRATQYSIPIDTAHRNLEELNRRSTVDAIDYDRLKTAAPHVAAYLANPNNAAISQDDVGNLEAIEKHNYVSNDLRGIGERFGKIFFDNLQFADKLLQNTYAALTETETEAALRTAGVSNYITLALANTGGGETVIDPSKMQVPEVNAKLSEVGEFARYVGQNIQGSLGYEPRYTFDRFLAEPSVKSLLGTIFEQGPISLADMLLAKRLPAAYATAISQDIAQTRVGKDVEPTSAQTAAMLPVAAVMQALEKFGAESVFATLPVGKIKTGDVLEFVKGLGKETLKRGGEEAGTEFTQEFLQVLAESVGTNNPVDVQQSFTRLLGAAVIGGGFGGTVGAASAGLQAVQKRNHDQVINAVASGIDQTNFDMLMDGVTNSTTAQRSPESFTELKQSVLGNRIVYASQEAVKSLLDKGVELPASIRKQLNGTGVDVQIGMGDASTSPEMIAALRKDLRMTPAGLTVSELQNSGDFVKAMIERASSAAVSREDIEQIQTSVQEQLIATGRQSPETARISSQVITSYIARAASEYGVEPSQIMQDMGLKVVGPSTPAETGGQVMEQQPPTSRLVAPGVKLTREYTVAETGSEVQVEHDAERLHAQTTKRRGVVEKVLKCLGT